MSGSPSISAKDKVGWWIASWQSAPVRHVGRTAPVTRRNFLGADKFPTPVSRVLQTYAESSSRCGGSWDHVRREWRARRLDGAQFPPSEPPSSPVLLLTEWDQRRDRRDQADEHWLEVTALPAQPKGPVNGARVTPAPNDRNNVPAVELLPSPHGIPARGSATIGRRYVTVFSAWLAASSSCLDRLPEAQLEGCSDVRRGRERGPPVGGGRGSNVLPAGPCTCVRTVTIPAA